MTRRRGAALAALATAAVAAPALAAFPAPTLSLQSGFSPPSGIARTDYLDQVTSSAGATVVDGDRIITAGTAGSGSSADVGVEVHRTDGSADTTFSDDGRVVVPVGAGTVEDRGIDVAVLDDHRIRVLATTGSGSTQDTAVLGLLADGTTDTSFGGGDGLVTLGTRLPNKPTAFAIAPDGRIAITGSSAANGGVDDTLVALLAADGSPVTFGGDPTGTILVDRGGTGVPDLGADIAWRPGGGLVVLGQTGASSATTMFLRAFTEAGDPDTGFSDDGDLDVGVGEPPTVPAALLAYGGRLWMTGSTRAGVDTNAFLARVDANGTNGQSRQFDMRGQLIDPAQSVTSAGEALAVVPGEPPTLVVGGSVTSASSTDWAAAAFNELDGDLASAGFGEIALSIPGSGGILGMAASGRGVAVSGPYQETVTTPSSSVTYTRLGEARLLVDADKACDLKLEITAPLELVLEPGKSGAVGLKVTNAGTRACSGTVGVPLPYVLGYQSTLGSIDTGTLAPGASFAATGAVVGYGGGLKATDTLTFTLTAPGDVDASNNAAKLGVRFSYCDLRLAAAGSARYLPSQGARRFAFTVGNEGTLACSGVRIGVGGQGRPGPRSGRYDVRAGRDVADAVAARLRKPAKPGDVVRIVFRAGGPVDPNGTNDTVTLNPTVIGVGDSALRTPRGRARVIAGTARGGRGPAPRAARRVTRVSVAVRRVGAGCRWLASAKARRFRTVSADASKGCPKPVWLRATGTTKWRLRTRGLPPGEYEVLSRATIGAGFSEAAFGSRDGNRVTFTVRR